MPPEEFKSLVLKEELTLTDSHQTAQRATLEYSPAPVGGYPATLWAYFESKQDGTLRLWWVMYYFNSINGAYADPDNEIMFAALREGLERTYGAPAVDRLGRVGESTKWILPDTEISLMKLDGGMGYYCAIEYRNEVALPEPTPCPIPNGGF